MANHRTHSRIAGAPDYDNPHFWDRRFATGQDVGEWLNSGEALIDAVLADLEGRGDLDSRIPRVLHLGPGVSKLGSKLRDACVQRHWNGCGIVNVDFSAEAVRLGRDAECQKPFGQAMIWHQADLLSWNDLSSVSHFAPFDVIVDKSTSDAIATFDDQVFTTEDGISRICPTVKDLLAIHHSITLSPVELLALHLAPLSRQGTTWVVLSYSSLRFDGRPFLNKHWSVRSRLPLAAPPGPVSASAHTPEIFHWLYILERK